MCHRSIVRRCQSPIHATNRSIGHPLARLVLEAAYEATLCAGILNYSRTGCNRLFLTLLGGGAFGNDPQWIFSAIRRAFDVYANCGLEVSIVSFGASNRDVRQLVNEYQ